MRLKEGVEKSPKFPAKLFEKQLNTSIKIDAKRKPGPELNVPRPLEGVASASHKEKGGGGGGGGREKVMKNAGEVVEVGVRNPEAEPSGAKLLIDGFV